MKVAGMMAIQALPLLAYRNMAPDHSTSTAGYGDEHDRPDRSSFRMHVGQSDFRYMVPFGKEHGPNAHSHEDQAESEERIQFPDQFIHRQEGSTEIIDQ